MLSIRHVASSQNQFPNEDALLAISDTVVTAWDGMESDEDIVPRSQQTHHSVRATPGQPSATSAASWAH